MRSFSWDARLTRGKRFANTSRKPAATRRGAGEGEGAVAGRGRAPQGGRPAGAPGSGRGLRPEDQVDEIVDHYPEHCRGCGRERSEEKRQPSRRFGRHHVAEVPPTAALVTEHRTHRLRCARCASARGASQSAPATTACSPTTCSRSGPRGGRSSPSTASSRPTRRRALAARPGDHRATLAA
jgi:hypothetical protein